MIFNGFATHLVLVFQTRLKAYMPLILPLGQVVFLKIRILWSDFRQIVYAKQ